VRVRGYFSKPKGIREQKGGGNTGVEGLVPVTCNGTLGYIKGVEVVHQLSEYRPLEK
jgi:hypothetical protein